MSFIILLCLGNLAFLGMDIRRNYLFQRNLSKMASEVRKRGNEQ